MEQSKNVTRNSFSVLGERDIPATARNTDHHPPSAYNLESKERHVTLGLVPSQCHAASKARAVTRRDLAETLSVNQPANAKLEQWTNVYLSSLRSYTEAVVGRLKIVAEFPEGDVAITNFSQVGKTEDPS